MLSLAIEMPELTLATLLMTEEESLEANRKRENRILTLKCLSVKKNWEMSEDEMFARGKFIAELQKLRRDRREQR